MKGKSVEVAVHNSGDVVEGCRDNLEMPVFL